MSLLIPERHYTPEELLSLPDDRAYELVDGQLVEREMGTESVWVSGQIFGRLQRFDLEARLGWFFPAEASYQCFPEDPRMVRRPDVSFIRRGRLPGERIPRGHTTLPPDLAVEVVSPNDLYSEVRRKVREYLQAGVRLVWVVDPDNRSLEVFRSDRSVTWLREDEEVTGEEVLPGFHCLIADLFPPAAGAAPEE